MLSAMWDYVSACALVQLIYDKLTEELVNIKNDIDDILRTSRAEGVITNREMRNSLVSFLHIIENKCRGMRLAIKVDLQ